jgi:hypothetical protein
MAFGNFLLHHIDFPLTSPLMVSIIINNPIHIGFLLLALTCQPSVFAQRSASPDSGGNQENLMDSPPVFDDICLGDAYKAVSEKLRKSTLLELTVNEIYLGRFGLNGSYRTKKTIGGLKCFLYFDWDGENCLKELTMQTEPLSASEYDSSLKKNWKDLIALMTTLHGKPLQGVNFPNSSLLQNDMSLNTHLWRIEAGGTAMLGTSKSTEGYMVSVRFVTETIQPAIIK